MTASSMLAIRKYTNRKHYIPGEGYISLRALVSRVEAGEEISVVLDWNKQDYTLETLVELLLIKLSNRKRPCAKDEEIQRLVKTALRLRT